MILDHYAHRPVTLDRSRVYTQPNPDQYQKPRGLWVSVRGDDDWPTWCLGEDFRIEGLRFAHTVTLAAGSYLRWIRSVPELDAFHDEYATPNDFDMRYHPDERGYWGINWWQVARCYDGIVIAPYLRERRLSRTCQWYYTWDCASGCIWNLDAIQSLQLRQLPALPMGQRDAVIPA